MLFKTIMFLLLCNNMLFSDILKKTYYTKTNDINLSTIVKNPKKDVILFKIQSNRYSKKIRSKDLINLLKKHNYNNFKYNQRYVKFVKKSPINLSLIRKKIKKIYKNKYHNIKITKISIEPRNYIYSLPKDYEINMQKRSYLSSTGILYIKTPAKKKLFFNYCIDAKVNVLYAKNNIKKGVRLSGFNVLQKTVLLERFRAMPLQRKNLSGIQAKHHIKQNTIVTVRDIEPLSLVKRDSNVNVSLISNGISITFGAKALQDGKLNDIITIQKSNKKRLKATVVGKNRVEIK